jgi:hypothetical protein
VLSAVKSIATYRIAHKQPVASSNYLPAPLSRLNAMGKDTFHSLSPPHVDNINTSSNHFMLKGGDAPNHHSTR